MLLARENKSHSRKPSKQLSQKGTNEDYTSLLHLSQQDYNSKLQISIFCPCGGSCPRCKAMENSKGFTSIQPNLKVSQTGNPLEIQADRIAEQIINMPYQNFQSKSQVNSDKENPIQFKKRNLAKVPPIDSDNFTKALENVTSEPGKPLDSTTKEFMESRFGYDFSNVRIHTGPTSDRLTNTFDALAFTHRNDIYLEARESTNKRLLAHELTHVIQQNYLPQNSSSIHRKPKPSANRPKPRIVKYKFNVKVPDYIFEVSDKDRRLSYLLHEYYKQAYDVDNNEARKIRQMRGWISEPDVTVKQEYIPLTVHYRVHTLSKDEQRAWDHYFNNNLSPEEQLRIYEETDRQFYQQTQYDVNKKLTEYDEYFAEYSQVWMSIYYSLILQKFELFMIPTVDDPVKDFVFSGRDEVRNYALGLELIKDLQKLSSSDYVEFTSRVRPGLTMKELKESLDHYLGEIRKRKQRLETREQQEKALKGLGGTYEKLFGGTVQEQLSRRKDVEDDLKARGITEEEFMKLISDYKQSFENETLEVANIMLDQYEAKLFEQEPRYTNPESSINLFNNLEEIKSQADYIHQMGQSTSRLVTWGDPEEAVLAPTKGEDEFEEAQFLESTALSEHPLLSDASLYREIVDKVTPQEIQSLMQQYISDQKEHIQTIRQTLKEKPKSIYNYDVLLKTSRKQFHAAMLDTREPRDSFYDLLIDKLITHYKDSQFFSNLFDTVFMIGLATLALALPGGAGLLVGAASLTLNTYTAFKMYEEFKEGHAAFKIGLSESDPSLAWVVLAFAFIPGDLAALTKNLMFVRTIEAFNKTADSVELSVRFARLENRLARLERRKILTGPQTNALMKSAKGNFLKFGSRIYNVLGGDPMPLIEAAYYASKRGINKLKSFLETREAKRLLGDIKNLSPETMTYLKEAYPNAISRIESLTKEASSLKLKLSDQEELGLILSNKEPMNVDIDRYFRDKKYRERITKKYRYSPEELDLAPGTEGTFNFEPSEILGWNLERAQMYNPGGHQAHHLVMNSGGWEWGKKSKDILTNAGIDINDASNGMWLPFTSLEGNTIPLSPVRHQPIHTKRYAEEIYKRLKPYEGHPDAVAIRDVLHQIRSEIDLDQFPY